MPSINLEDYSEDDLNDLIDQACSRRDELRASREKEAGTGLYGSKGQDVKNPSHGAIAAPTPNAVEDVGPAHGA